jgi:hypothetical protein
MATDGILGLFTDPYQYMQQQNQAQNRAATEFAQLTPMQQAQFGIYKGAGQIGGAFAGAMGVQDPVLQRQSQRQQLLKGLDFNDPVALANASRAALEMNDVQASREFSAAAERLKATQLEAEVKKSQIARNLRERPANMSELSKLQSEREDLIAQFGENDPRVKEINALIAKKTTGGGIGSEIAAGLSPLVGAMAVAQAKKAAEAGGTEVGKQTANIQGKYTALSSIKDALDILDKGIYSGGYGPLQEAAAKYGAGIIRKDRLANTQEFRAYIGDVVIPRLQEFGGNDSVEELNYLRSVMAGDTSMEGTAIKNILKRADNKIKAGIARLEKQQTAITTGQPLPIGDLGTPAATPKPTKRFNPVTNTLETL